VLDQSVIGQITLGLHALHDDGLKGFRDGTRKSGPLPHQDPIYRPIRRRVALTP